jgi:hypothetical protein
MLTFCFFVYSSTNLIYLNLFLLLLKHCRNDKKKKKTNVKLLFLLLSTVTSLIHVNRSEWVRPIDAEENWDAYAYFCRRYTSAYAYDNYRINNILLGKKRS